MAVAFESGSAFKLLKTVKLFEWPTLATPGPARTYDVSRDGQRFLMIKEADSGRASGVAAPITVVMNWVEELKAKLPAK